MSKLYAGVKQMPGRNPSWKETLYTFDNEGRFFCLSTFALVTFVRYTSQAGFSELNILKHPHPELYSLVNITLQNSCLCS